jgi:hypothetical protein
VSIGALFNAHLSIFRIKISARTNIDAPPYSCKRAGPRHPKITLPYSNVVTANAYTSCILTLLLCNPNNLAWHFILLNAACALFILFSNIVQGLLFALFMTSPRYLNSATFLISYEQQLKTTSIFIYIALVLETFIYNPFIAQNT